MLPLYVQAGQSNLGLQRSAKLGLKCTSVVHATNLIIKLSYFDFENKV